MMIRICDDNIYVYDGISPLLKDYEQLVIAFWIMFKPINPTFKALHYLLSAPNCWGHTVFHCHAVCFCHPLVTSILAFPQDCVKLFMPQIEFSLFPVKSFLPPVYLYLWMVLPFTQSFYLETPFNSLSPENPICNPSLYSQNPLLQPTTSVFIN